MTTWMLVERSERDGIVMDVVERSTALGNVLERPKVIVRGVCSSPAHYGESESTANARLIVTAPELLAAFKRMRQGYLNLAEMGLVSDSTKLSLEVYVAEADRLIAKVEGRA